MSTDLENTATNFAEICSKINASISAIASIETELAKNTALSFMVITNALLGKGVTTEKTAVVTTAKPKVRRKERKSKAAAIATSAIEKAAADTADASVAA